MKNSKLSIAQKDKAMQLIKSSKKKLIKVQLDHKTVMFLSHMSALKVWLQRYPNAKVITT